MICEDCQTDNRTGRRFCSNCGAALPIRCPTCGFENEPEDTFCGGCGSPLTEKTPPGKVRPDTGQGQNDDGQAAAHGAAEPERRQVTTLFVDLSGFTKLSSTLPAEDVHRLVRRFFEVVDKIVLEYGGSVDKHIGDAVMALFGAPVAHDNDSERAVHAAVDIHNELRELSVELGLPLKAHIGVASGRVVASGIGGVGHREYTVLGDSVNLAARLVDQAGPEETYLSDMVYRAVARLVEAECVGDRTIKGIDSTVKIWRLLRFLEKPSEQNLTSFFGRQGEIRQLRGVLESFRELERGQAVYIRGEAGIGKSRLVKEFVKLAIDQGIDCHTALILDFGVGKGRGCIYSLLRSVLELTSQQEYEAEEDIAARTIATGLIDPAQAMFLKDLLHVPQSKEHRATYDAMDNETRNIGKRGAVVTLLQRLSARTPLLIVIEDLHWADPVTLGHLSSLTVMTMAAPVVLVMTSRFDGDPIDTIWRQATASAPLVTIDLAPLSEAEAQSFARELFDTTSRFATNCVERAQGNPLFLEQLLQSAEQISENDVPGSIQSLVLAQLDRLPPKDRQALQAASVLGQRFTAAAVKHLVEDTSWMPDVLVQHRLVRPIGQEYLFSHALIWEGVYATLLRDQLGQLHRRAAKWFASADLGLKAEHLERAGSPNTSAAFLSAAKEQASLYHFEQARAMVERGLTLVRDRGERHGLTMLLGECLRELGRPSESIEPYEQALEAATTDVLRCRAWIGLAAAMRVLDEYDRALDMLAKAESAAAGDPRLAAELSNIHYYRGNIFFPLGNIEGCLEQHELALQHGRLAKSVECEARALSGLGDASYSQGRMITALNNFRRCVELSESNDLGRIAVNNHYMVAWTRLYLKEVTGSSDDAEHAVQSAEQAGQLRSEMVARLTAGRTLLEFADLEKARAHLIRGVDIAKLLKANRFRPFFEIFLSRIDLIEGASQSRIVEALKLAETISRETGVGFVGPWVLSSLALATSDIDLGAKALEEGEKLLVDGCVGHNYFGFYADAMEVSLQNGDWEAVENFARSLEAYMEAEALPLSRFQIDRARALAEFSRDPCNKEARKSLLKLKETAQRANLNMSLRAIDTALGAVT